MREKRKLLDMKSDIEIRADIDRLMHLFYERAMVDETIGYFFTDVARLDLEHHLPIIGDFWESLLFGTGVYARHGRNPLMVHRDLHDQSALSREHFERWLELFTTAVDDLFAGERADFIKLRARAIAARMVDFLGVESGDLVTPAEMHAANSPHRQ
jgi:hemoglobin